MGIIGHMGVLPQRFILTKGPRDYLVQGLSHCGAYSVKGILSFYSKDDGRSPVAYHSGKLGNLTGLMFSGAKGSKLLLVE